MKIVLILAFSLAHAAASHRNTPRSRIRIASQARNVKTEFGGPTYRSDTKNNANTFKNIKLTIQNAQHFEMGNAFVQINDFPSSVMSKGLKDLIASVKLKSYAKQINLSGKQGEKLARAAEQSKIGEEAPSKVKKKKKKKGDKMSGLEKAWEKVKSSSVVKLTRKKVKNLENSKGEFSQQKRDGEFSRGRRDGVSSRRISDDDFSRGRRDVDVSRGRRDGKFSRQRRDGEFSRGRHDGGFSRGRRDGEFSRGRRDGEFSRGRRDGEFSRGRRDDEFSRGRRDGDFSRGRRDGEFSRGRRDGGFSRGRRDDGYSRGRRDGDFSRRGRDDEFSRGRRDDEFSRGRRDGEFSRGRRDGGFSRGRRDGEFSRGRPERYFGRERRDSEFSREGRDGYRGERLSGRFDRFGNFKVERGDRFRSRSQGFRQDRDFPPRERGRDNYDSGRRDDPFDSRERSRDESRSSGRDGSRGRNPDGSRGRGRDESRGHDKPLYRGGNGPQSGESSRNRDMVDSRGRVREVRYNEKRPQTEALDPDRPWLTKEFFRNTKSAKVKELLNQIEEEQKAQALARGKIPPKSGEGVPQERLSKSARKKIYQLAEDAQGKDKLSGKSSIAEDKAQHEITYLDDKGKPLSKLTQHGTHDNKPLAKDAEASLKADGDKGIDKDAEASPNDKIFTNKKELKRAMKKESGSKQRLKDKTTSSKKTDDFHRKKQNGKVTGEQSAEYSAESIAQSTKKIPRDMPTANGVGDIIGELKTKVSSNKNDIDTVLAKEVKPSKGPKRATKTKGTRTTKRTTKAKGTKKTEETKGNIDPTINAAIKLETVADGENSEVNVNKVIMEAMENPKGFLKTEDASSFAKDIKATKGSDVNTATQKTDNAADLATSTDDGKNLER